MTGWLSKRLDQMERVLSGSERLVPERFTAADLLMADVLRVPLVRQLCKRPATEAYVSRILERPAFQKAYADQTAHFERADAWRKSGVGAA